MSQAFINSAWISTRWIEFDKQGLELGHTKQVVDTVLDNNELIHMEKKNEENSQTTDFKLEI